MQYMDTECVLMSFVCLRDLPSHGIMKLRRSLMLPLRSSMFLSRLLTAALASVVLLLSRSMEAKQDLRDSIINGNEPCFRYNLAKSLFYMNCSVLDWQAQGYEPDTYISLGKNETFDGGDTVEGDTTKPFIDLSGIVDFQGLFEIKNNEVRTFAEAPLIRNIHVRNGTVVDHGGFIVRRGQKFFEVDSCSSSGNIPYRAGGISGFLSGHDNGEIKISKSYSTGKILYGWGGGIVGRAAGYDGGLANITQCHSTGSIGRAAGGICGSVAGGRKGTVFITQSYSTGDIVGSGGGGIVGNVAGPAEGYVHIQECYTTGKISAHNSGGISGALTAARKGNVHISNCYTRGDICSNRAGGITGKWTGGSTSLGSYSGSHYGNVYINKTYASGITLATKAGGIIGNIDSSFREHTNHVQYSVYTDKEEGKIVGDAPGNYSPKETGNSGDLNDMRGQLYHYEGIQRWDGDIWDINGSDTLPILRFQLLAGSSPTPRTTRVRILPVQRPLSSVKQQTSQRKRKRNEAN